MGNSKIYFYPGGASYGGLETIDFGERLSDLQITPYRDVSDSVSMGGAFSRVARRSGMQVRIVLERFTDEQLAERFYSLQSHLEAGGGFSFAVDDTKKFCAFVNIFGRTPGERYSMINHNDVLLSEYGAHGLAVDDVLHLESFGPGGRREELQVSAYDSPAKNITIKSPLVIYDHPMPAFVRHRDFFPYLVWPESQMNSPIITHDHRISYTVDFTCEIYPGNTRAAYQKAGPDGVNMAPGATELQDGVTIDNVFMNGGWMLSDVATYESTVDSSPMEQAIRTLEILNG
jgi:hypothetical protein